MIRVATRARSIDELVAKLAPFADEDGVLLPAPDDVVTGAEERLVLELADRRVVLSGRVSVDAAAGSSTASPVLVRVTFRELDMEGRRVHERLLARRRLDSTRMRVVTPGLPPSDSSVMMPLPAAPPRSPSDQAALAALVERVTVEAGADDGEAQNPTRKLSAAPSQRLSPFPERPGSQLGNDDETVVAISSEDVVPIDGPSRRRRPTPPPQPPRLPASRPTPAPPAAVDVELTPPVVATTSSGEGRDASIGAAPKLEQISPEATGSRRTLVARQLGPVERVRGFVTSDAFRARARRFAPWLLAGLAGFLIGRIGGGAESTPQPVAAPVAVPSPPRAPVAPSPALPEREAPAPTPSAAAARPRPTGCSATVRSDPPGAVVQWGDATLGETPLVGVTVPCGRALVALRRPRYQQVVRNVTAAATEPVTVQERLARPEAQLVVTSRPPGAAIVVNGQERGRAPAELTVARYETVRLQAKLAGHRAAAKKLYVDGSVERVELKLAAGR